MNLFDTLEEVDRVAAEIDRVDEVLRKAMKTDPKRACRIQISGFLKLLEGATHLRVTAPRAGYGN